MKSIDEIYHAHAKMVFNLALQYVQNTEDAEEITQDVFVNVYQSIDKFRQEAKLSTWIYRITINKSLDYTKAKKRKKRFAFITSIFNINDELMHEPVHFEHPGVLMENKEEMRELFSYINDLPDNQKTALILNAIEQKSHKEIAEIMNTSPKAVESLIQRAKTNLQKKLNNTRDR